MSHPPCDRLVVAFELNQRPQPKRRARHGQGRTYTDARTVAFEADLARECRAAMAEQNAELTTEEVELLILCEQTDRRHAGDWDNLGKVVSDALNGVAYKDDRQVVDGRVIKALKAPVDRVSVAVLRAAIA